MDETIVADLRVLLDGKAWTDQEASMAFTLLGEILVKHVDEVRTQLLTSAGFERLDELMSQY